MESEEGRERWRQDAEEFVEQLGLLAESHGHPRMAGRVLGWLLVCQPPHQTVAELADGLKASRSAVNAVVNLLAGMSMLERVALPGERSIYFQVPDDGGLRFMRSGLPNLAAMRAAAELGLSRLGWREAGHNRRLVLMRDLYAFFEREMPLLIESWEREIRSREG